MGCDTLCVYYIPSTPPPRSVWRHNLGYVRLCCYPKIWLIFSAYLCFCFHTLACPSVNPDPALLRSWQKISWDHTLVDMGTAALFNIILFKLLNFPLCQDLHSPVGVKVLVHKVLDHSIPEVFPSSPEHIPYFWMIFSRGGIISSWCHFIYSFLL